MKHFRRILFNTLTAASLLMALATAGLWARSGLLEQHVDVSYRRLSGDEGTAHDVVVSIRCGTVHVRYESKKRPASKFRASSFFEKADEAAFKRGEPVYDFWYGSVYLEGSGYSPSLLERVFGDGTTFSLRRTSDVLLCAFPLWLPLLLLSTVPSVRVISYMRRQRSGRCPACGYDMRANPARCSECGYVAEGMRS